MKLAFLLAVILSLGAKILADDAEIQSARARYEDELEMVTKPVRDRYLATLESAKKTALLRNDTKSANEIATEIKRVAVLSDLGGAKAALCGYLWSNHQDKWEFNPNGKLVQHGTGWAGKSWRFSPDQKSVELTFFNDKHHVYAFKDGVLIHFDPGWGAFQKNPLD